MDSPIFWGFRLMDSPIFWAFLIKFCIIFEWFEFFEYENIYIFNVKLIFNHCFWVIINVFFFYNKKLEFLNIFHCFLRKMAHFLISFVQILISLLLKHYYMHILSKFPLTQLNFYINCWNFQLYTYIFIDFWDLGAKKKIIVFC